MREERKLRNRRKKFKKDLGLNGNIDKACFKSKDVRGACPRERWLCVGGSGRTAAPG